MDMINAKKRDYMLTATGQRFDPADFDPAIINIEDIAHSLANQCRYGGHLPHFYSVAQHSVLVMELLKVHKRTSLQRWGLLHDAAEAYIGDMVYPLKRQFPDFKKFELTIEEGIAERFNLTPTYEPETVRAADLSLLAWEGWNFEFGDPIDVAFPKTRFRPWQPEEARERFLDEAERLGLTE
jgi:hypothetical protein